MSHPCPRVPHQPQVAGQEGEEGAGQQAGAGPSVLVPQSAAAISQAVKERDAAQKMYKYLSEGLHATGLGTCACECENACVLPIILPAVSCASFGRGLRSPLFCFRSLVQHTHCHIVTMHSLVSQSHTTTATLRCFALPTLFCHRAVQLTSGSCWQMLSGKPARS